MKSKIPYEEIISLQIFSKNITYRKTIANPEAKSDMDAYIIYFNDKKFTPLSTIIEKSKNPDEIEKSIIESLCNSEQGKCFAEVAYLAEHCALADCVDYYVELDTNAYLIYIQLSDKTDIYGAIGKDYTLSAATMFFKSKQSRIDIKDRVALDTLRVIEKNILRDRMGK